MVMGFVFICILSIIFMPPYFAIKRELKKEREAKKVG